MAAVEYCQSQHNPNRDVNIPEKPQIKPKYPDFKSEWSRRRTYEHWPRSMRQTPSALAKAGFLYIGSSDKLVCFYCGGGIKDWSDDDIPWEEHAFWFKDCPFVKLIKGDVYIKNLRECKMTCRKNSNISVLTCKHAEILCPQEKSKHPMLLNADSSSNSSGSEAGLCRRCGTEKSDAVFLPCGHVNTCYACSPFVHKCPSCGTERTEYIKLYHS